MSDVYKEVFGCGQPIVMLHGWAMHTGIWRDFAQDLAKNYQVHCLDLCGHGRSSNIEPYDLETIVDCLALALPEQPSIIVGWSLGGNIALSLAEKYPQRICAVSLIASNPHFLNLETWPGVNADVLTHFTENLLKNCYASLGRFMSLQMQGMPDFKEQLKKLRMAMTECDEPNLEVLMLALDILKQTDSRPSLQALKIPVQAIFGELDSLVPIDVASQCLLINKALDIHCIAGAGHAPFISHKRQVLNALHCFIAENLSR